ncbi:MAG: O-antigen ligase family protein, partial [Chitinophagaceae bacterium]|nr:O-antigen ligase family protein [Chitinophagaceae bacterium]
MAKKSKPKDTTSKTGRPAPAAPSKPRTAPTVSSLIPLGFFLAYMGVHFIPNLDAYDAMGPQWFYVVWLDLATIIYILIAKANYNTAVKGIFSHLFTKLFLAFFVLAGLSALAAINPTETLVCYVRLVATIIAFFNLGILFYQRLELFKWIAQLLGFILLIESYLTITAFLNGFGQMSMTDLIMSLKGTTGNKNIFAAGLVVKIPFVMYSIYTAGIWRRVLNIGILLIGTITIFILNARASYLSLILIAALYTLFVILEYRKQKQEEQTLYRLAYIVVPLLAALFISQIELSNIKSLQEDNAGKDFGSVTERLGSLSATSDESNQVRLRLWSHAVDYTKHHPLMGCGYGNWKIASIPYQRLITNDLYVPIHAHNDFVEEFAELGIPGGLLYLSLFVCILVFTIRTYLSAASADLKLIAVFSLLAFAGYSVDALFNFPLERPISQVFFALITAVNVLACLAARKQVRNEKEPETRSTWKPVYGLTAILLLLPSAYVTYLTYQSLIVQRIIIPDIEHEPLQLKWQELFPKIPSIPNISA